MYTVTSAGVYISSKVVCVRFTDVEVSYLDKIVKSSRFRNKGEYIKFACIHSGGTAKVFADIRRWLVETGVLDR